jgi:hypothetical protein
MGAMGGMGAMAGGGGAAGSSDRLSQFIEVNRLDHSATARLMDLNPREQEWVMEQGFVIGSDPARGTDSAVVMGRCKKVKNPEVQAELQNAPSTGGAAVSSRCEEFIQVNRLDAACAGVLRQLSPELLTKVMGDDFHLNINEAKGSTSSVVMGRIKRARQEAGGEGGPAAKMARTDSGTGAEADLSAAPQSFGDGGFFQKGSRNADFIQLNELDEFCIRALQTCDQGQLDWIMDRGFKIHATPDEPASGVVSNRMKEAKETVTSYTPSSADLTQRVSDFVSINQLDSSCSDRLRSLPMEDQLKVMEEGYILWQINEGRGNRNSIVMGRMKKVAPRV